MHITKLTLTPIATGCPKVVLNKPSNASQLIKEKILMPQNNSTNPPRILRKIPDYLKSWVNTNCKITNY